MIATINGNALSIPLPDKVVQCVITSPPYWGLRDYGTAKWEGGNPECDHSPARKNGDSSSTLSGGKATISHKHEGYYDTCGKCGAIRIDQQIGLEPTPQAYVSNIVAVMRECWRVMRDDGTLWLVIGDSYNSGGGTTCAIGSGLRDNRKREPNYRQTIDSFGLKPKDLCGIPWRVAFALQDDGWYLRSDIIWSKPNPMPESVTDRPTKAHEYVFLLAKQERYYYNQDTIREPHAEATLPRAKRGVGENNKWSSGAPGSTAHTMSQPRPNIKNSCGTQAGAGSSFVNGHSGYYGPNGRLLVNPDGRNKRSVWTVATENYSGSHFATFPTKLVEPMILAGSRPGDIILDPFAGTSTVGRVCAKHGRQFIGVELNPAYIELAENRTSGVQIMLSAYSTHIF